MQKKSDDEVLQLLYSNNEKKYGDAIQYLKQSMFNVIKNMIVNKGGTSEIAEDIFWEGMLEVDRWTRLKKFETNSNVSGFLRTVCERKWYNMANRDKHLKNVALPDNLDYILKEDPISEVLLSEKLRKVLDQLMKKVGEKCQEKLELFYYQGLSHQEIADLLNLASKNVVATSISRCIKKLREEMDKLGGKKIFMQ